MTKLDELKLADIMPPNLLKDNVIKTMCEALDIQLQKLEENNKKLSIYANIDNLPENIIDYLAWHFHVDFYDDSLDIKQKRDSVKKSIIWHKSKGTAGMVEDYLITIFGGAEVIEWFDYGAQPYHFKIDLLTAAIPDLDSLRKIIKAIFTIKNTRSWCDELGFKRDVNGNIYYGGIVAQEKAIDIYPAIINMPNVSSIQFMGGGIEHNKNTKVYPAIVNMPDVLGTLQQAGINEINKEVKIYG